MSRTIHNAIQGSHEWHSLRADYFTASEASAMLGISKYQSRDSLLKKKKFNIQEDIDASKQRLFDAGHDAEDSARPIAEEIIGDELFPATMSCDIDGLPLLASLDGITMDESVVFEHKLASTNLIAATRAGSLDPHYSVQLEQQLMVTGASRALFMVSDGTKDNMAYLWYESNPEIRSSIVAGWKQFREDLANYQHAEVIPAAVAEPIESLGSLVLQVEGRVTSCNIDAFKASAQAFISRLPKADELTTDQHFANADLAAKECADAEDRIKAAKAAAMAQAASIDEVFRAVDHVSELIRAARLSLEKAVKARKDSIRIEIMQAARKSFDAHMENLIRRVGNLFGQLPPPDFATAIKGKKSLTSLRDACDTELARAKIAASEMADKIELNQRTLREMAADYPMLLKHEAQLVLKAPDDMVAQIKSWIFDYNEAEAKRKEAEAEKKSEADRQVSAAACIANDQPSVQSATVQPITADTGATLRLGEINSRLALLSITSESLKRFGFNPTKDGAAYVVRESDFPAICAAIVRHVQSIANTTQGRKAA